MENWMKALREQTSLSQQKFADWSGIPLRTVQDWEGEKRCPSDWTKKMVRFWVEEHLKKEASE